MISGIWHGAGWNFILWGFLHGLFLIAYRLFPLSLSSAAGRGVTLAAVMFSWLFFYETDFQLLMRKVMSLFSPQAYGFTELAVLGEGLAKPEGLLSLVLIGFSLLVIGIEARSLRSEGRPYGTFFRPWVLVLLIIFTVWMAPGKSSAFIYFAFIIS